VKVTVDGTDGDGKPLHNEWTGKFDGKDYPVTGDSSTDTRSYKKVTIIRSRSPQEGDKVTISGRGVVSADGKTRTVTITGTDSKGRSLQALRCTTSSRATTRYCQQGLCPSTLSGRGQEFSRIFSHLLGP